MRYVFQLGAAAQLTAQGLLMVLARGGPRWLLYVLVVLACRLPSIQSSPSNFSCWKLVSCPVTVMLALRAVTRSPR